MKAKFCRRLFLVGLIVMVSAFSSNAVFAADDIKVGAIFDLTGGLNIYGT
jgi:hypothetical protein